jgi:hypothetical protein
MATQNTNTIFVHRKIEENYLHIELRKNNINKHREAGKREHLGWRVSTSLVSGSCSTCISCPLKELDLS